MKWYLAGALGAAALLAACTDARQEPTSPQPTAVVPGGVSASYVTGAVFTSTNPADDPNLATDDHDLCTNAKDPDAPAINCNIYRDKSFVWLSGGPGTSGLSDGTYVFAVLVPGGQGDPNDCVDKNLSDNDPCPTSLTPGGDPWTHRVFSIAGGVVTYPAVGYPGGHDFDVARNMIRVFPYDDTTNPGGEYDLAVCNLAGATNAALDAAEGTYPPGVDPNLCKYDNFKVMKRAAVCPNPEAGDCQFHSPATLTIVKTLNTEWKRSFTWDPTKDADKTKVSQVGGSVIVNYTVVVTGTKATESIKFSGTVTVTNGPSAGVAHNVVITDPNAPSLDCSPFVQGSDLAPGASVVCTYSETPATTAPVTNTARVDWASVDVNGDPTTPHLEDQKNGTFTADDTDECTLVTDAFNGGSGTTLGTVCIADSPKTFTYSRTIAVTANTCTDYKNIVTTNTTDTHTTDTADHTVTICGGVAGGLTMGFWQNKNGQGIITGGASVAGVCKSGTWLRGYAPFQDLSATATCAQVATYVYNLIKAANASGAAMNAMLKAQMMATALDVYFSDPALGTNKINAPAPIGGIKVDLTKICKMIDGSGGTATCSGIYSDASAAFGGATALTVSQILTYAANQSNSGGSVWYGQVKATQELAKNTFDAINNAVALTAP